MILQINFKGFTLLELLLTIGIFVTLLFFCMPFGESLNTNNQMQLLSDEIKRAIQFARTQSLLHGETYALTPLSNSRDWSTGMVLFTDTVDHQYRHDSQLIYKWQWTPKGSKIEWHGFQSRHYLIFASDIRHSVVNGYFLIQNKAQQRKLIVNRLGRVKDFKE